MSESSNVESLTREGKNGGTLQVWPKGQSGNPAGRPKGAVGLARYIREHSLDGRKLADFLVRVVDCEDGTMDGCKLTMDHRLEAVRILLNRGFGRPVEQLVVEGGAASLSDIIMQAYTRRQVGGEGEAMKDARATITDAPREGERAQGDAGGDVSGKKKTPRDSKGKVSKRGAGRRHDNI